VFVQMRERNCMSVLLRERERERDLCVYVDVCLRKRVCGCVRASSNKYVLCRCVYMCYVYIHMSMNVY
jgi:hypothetical protein